MYAIRASSHNREARLGGAGVRAVRLRRDAARPRLETAPTATPHIRERSAPLSNMLGWSAPRKISYSLVRVITLPQRTLCLIFLFYFLKLPLLKTRLSIFDRKILITLIKVYTDRKLLDSDKHQSLQLLRKDPQIYIYFKVLYRKCSFLVQTTQ